MKQKLVYVAAFLLLLSLFLTACGGSKVVPVSLPFAEDEEIGSAMPEILYANESQVIFWGEFGLFAVDSATGDIQKNVDLSKINSNDYKGCNHQTGDVITKFWMSEDEKNLYFINTGYGVSQSEQGPKPHALRLEDLTLEEYVVDDLNIMPPAEAVSFEYFGLSPDGYTSGLYISEAAQKAYYLRADDWYVNQLQLVSYDPQNGQKQVVDLF